MTLNFTSTWNKMKSKNWNSIPSSNIQERKCKNGAETKKIFSCAGNFARGGVVTARGSERKAYLNRTPRELCRGTICQRLPDFSCWRRGWRQKAPSAGNRTLAKEQLERHLETDLNDDNHHDDDDPRHHVASDVLVTRGHLFYSHWKRHITMRFVKRRVLTLNEP